MYRSPRYHPCTSRQSPSVLFRPAIAAALLSASLLSGCAPGRTLGSYFPVGAAARYGDDTRDGVTFLLRVEPPTALGLIEESFQSAGLQVHSSTGSGDLRRLASGVWDDTTMVIVAEVIPVELPQLASSVVLTGTYSISSTGARDLPVIERRGESSPLYMKLKGIGAMIRQAQAASRPAPR